MRESTNAKVFLLSCLSPLVYVTQSAFLLTYPIVPTRNSCVPLSTVSFMSSDMKNNNDEELFSSLSSYLAQKGIDNEISEIICSVAGACADIAAELSKGPLIESENYYQKTADGSEDHNYECRVNVQGETQKRMDVIANNIFISRVQNKVAAMASEEDENIIRGNPRKMYEIAFDPLDGSSNLDINAPTGTIFGIAPHNQENLFSSSARSLVAAGYDVYSSSVDFVVSLGNSGSMGASCFTLIQVPPDPNTVLKISASTSSNASANCFRLSRKNIKCPNHGPYYSLNEGREPDWPEGLKQWIHDAKRGKTPCGTTFSCRYVCSLCADVHRTLLKEGWAGNPRPHLRLIYEEAAPLAHCAEACGGKGSNGVHNILDIEPLGLHDRGKKKNLTSFFFFSPTIFLSNFFSQYVCLLGAKVTLQS